MLYISDYLNEGKQRLINDLNIKEGNMQNQRRLVTLPDATIMLIYDNKEGWQIDFIFFSGSDII